MARYIVLLTISCVLLIGRTQGEDLSKVEWEPSRRTPIEMYLLGSVFQPITTSLTELKPGHPEHSVVYNAMLAYQEDWNKKASGFVTLEFSSPNPWRIEGNAIREIFPEFRFYIFMYNECATEETKRRGFKGFLAHLRIILVEKDGNIIARIRGGEYCCSTFAKFLKEIGFIIKDDEIQLLRDAYCEISRMGDCGGEITKIGPLEWEFCIPSRSTRFRDEKGNYRRHTKDGRILTRVYGCFHYTIKLNSDGTIDGMDKPRIRKIEIHKRPPKDHPDLMFYRYAQPEATKTESTNAKPPQPAPISSPSAESK